MLQAAASKHRARNFSAKPLVTHVRVGGNTAVASAPRAGAAVKKLQKLAGSKNWCRRHNG